MSIPFPDIQLPVQQSSRVDDNFDYLSILRSNGGFPLIPRPIYTPLFMRLGVGDNVVALGKSGKKSGVAITAHNQTGAGINLQQRIDVGTGSLPAGAAFAVGANASVQAAILFNTYPILEANQQAIYNAAAIGVILSGYILEVDSSWEIKSWTLPAIANGDNLVYTCPSGKIAVGLNPSNIAVGANFKIHNASGGARNYSCHHVPFGSSSTSLANRFQLISAVADQTQSSFNADWALGAGDMLWINANGAGGNAFGFLMEIPF